MTTKLAKFNNEETSKELMTTEELAQMLGVTGRTIRRTAQKLSEVLHPIAKNSQGGYLFTKEQATAIKKEIQKHHNLQSRKIDNAIIKTGETKEMTTKQQNLTTNEKLKSLGFEEELKTGELLCKYINENGKEIEFYKIGRDFYAKFLCKLGGTVTIPALMSESEVELILEILKDLKEIDKLKRHGKKATY